MKNLKGVNLQSYGLEELLSETKQMIDKNKDLVSLSTSKTKTEEKMENILNEKINIDSGITFNIKIEKIISAYYTKFDYLDLNKNIKDLIQSFILQYNNKCQSIIQENLKPIVFKEAKTMKNDLNNILTKVLKKYGNIISINQDGYFNEYQKTITNSLKNIADECGMKNINTEIEKIIVKEIKNNIQNKIKDYINKI